MCGLLVELQHLDNNHEYCCKRCGSVLYKPGQSFGYIISMAISSLLFLCASVFLVFISFSVMGNTIDVSVIDALTGVISHGGIIVGILVLLFGIVIPVLLLLLLLRITVPFHFKRKPRSLKLFFGNYQRLKHWAMADVYILAIVIAMIKLIGYGSVEPGLGAIAFLLFLFSFYAAYAWFNPYDIWYDDAK